MAKNNKLKVVAAEPLDSLDDVKIDDVSLPEKSGEKKDGKDTGKGEVKDAKDAKDAGESAEGSIGKDNSNDAAGDAAKDGKVAVKDSAKDSVKDAAGKGSAGTVAAGKDSADTEEAPPKPNRPVDPIEQKKLDLKEAFPNVDDVLITTVLIASSGVLEKAFNALLYYSDPSIKPEISLKTPILTPKIPTTTDDELLARKLQQEFEEEERRRHQQRKQRKEQRRNTQQVESDSPDEFEQFKETFTQGFEEAKSTINSWVSGLAKKFDGDSAADQQQNRQNHNTQQQQRHQQNQRQQQQPGKLYGALGGRSYNQFDEDPKIINTDFNRKINMSNTIDDNDDDLPSLPKRKSDNINQSNKKWQPLNSDIPTNSDTFLVDDSDEEVDLKKNKL